MSGGHRAAIPPPTIPRPSPPPPIMRLLWVKAGKLLPVDTGGKIRSFHLLRQLAARHETTVLSYHDGAPDPEYARRLAEALPGATAVTTGRSDAEAAQRARYLASLGSSVPFAVAKFTSPRVRRLVADALASGRYDVAVCDFLSATGNFPAVPPAPSVLFQHNVESALWRRQAACEAHPVRRAAFALEARKMARYEPRAVARFHHVVAVSAPDATTLRSMTDPARVTVVPTGVDLAGFRRAATEPGDAGPLVVFLGSMDWEPNIDGVEWLVRAVWPTVRAAVPEARLRIVGRNPHARIQRLACDAITLTGRVSAVADHVRDAAVVVVPLRIGGGTRLKIFEAMAMRKAVVSTSIGAEGLEVRHGHDILLADDAPAFAAHTIAMLRDVGARTRLADAGARLAARHDWSVVVDAFHAALERAVEAARRTGVGTRAPRAAA